MDRGLETLKCDTLEFWSNCVTYAMVTIDGTTEWHEIFKRDVSDDSVRFLIYLDADIQNLQRVVLYNRDGRAVRSVDSKLERAPEGLVVVFKWTINITEEVVL